MRKVKCVGVTPNAWRGIVLLLVAMAAPVLFWVTSYDGEHGRQRDGDPELYALQTFLRYPWMPADAKERAQEAMTKYCNDTLEPEPVLIVASLERAIGIDQIYLALVVFDECEDLVGFVVREEHHDLNGAPHVFEERYGAFVHLQSPGVADVFTVPVHIRDKDQRKDEERWANYCEKPSLGHAPESTGRGKSQRTSASLWKDTLPRIWISIPEANNVVVTLYVYDRAGHRSNEVKLVNRLKGEWE